LLHSCRHTFIFLMMYCFKIYGASRKHSLSFESILDSISKPQLHRSLFKIIAFYFWKIIPCPINPSPFKIRPNIHSKSSFEFNEVNWIQIHWTKFYFEIEIPALVSKSDLNLILIQYRILKRNSKSLISKIFVI
jgi:hypothetical protein